MTTPGFYDPSVDSTVELPVDLEPYRHVAPVWPKTVINQYANSPRITGIIESFAAAIDAAALTERFFRSIWNIDTAEGYGLDVWGRIVNVKRTLYVPGGETGDLLGFVEEGVGNVFGFGQAPFNTLFKLTPNYVLLDDDFRRLILVKAFSNIADRSIPTMNAALLQLFPGRGNVYVSDDGDMRGTFVFGFEPEPLELAILTQSGAFATPSGVRFGVRVLLPGALLGFAEEGDFVAPFGTGTFFS